MSQQLEQEVLGILLAQSKLDNPLIAEALFKITRNHFSIALHQNIFDYLRHVHFNDKPVDMLEITNVDFGYIAGLANNSGALSNLDYYCSELIKSSELSRIKLETQTASRQISECNSLEEAIKLSSQLSHRLLDKASNGLNFDSAADINRLVYEDFENPEGCERLPTGDFHLDEILGGGILKPSLNVLAGQSGTGKTTYAAKILNGLCLKHNYKCAFFSLEMSTLRISEMLLSQNKNIPRCEFKSKGAEFFRDPLNLLLKNNNLHICPSKSMSIEEIFVKARYLKAKYGLDFVFIDFLTALDVEEKCNSEYQQINYIMKSVADMAADMDVAIFLLAQLNRGVVNSKDGKPNLSHLKGSSSIENFADHVLFTHRDVITNPDCNHQYFELLIRKNRYGRVGSVFYESIDGTIFDTDQAIAKLETDAWIKGETKKTYESNFEF